MENVPVTTNPAAEMPVPTTPLAAMQSNLSRQPIMKQIGFLLAIAASIVLGGYILNWALSPSYQVLFNGIQPKEASEVVSILQQSNVDYKLDPNTGAILVPASEVQRLRLKLAAEGFPKSAAHGMEMLNEEQGFGTSQFIERARYQRAMEEELARSISEINAISNARVHLATPRQSVFIRDRKPPTASVVVNLYPGRILDKGQIMAITHMVASSVPNMSSQDVTVVDQRGNLLTKGVRDSSVALSDSQMEYTEKLEQRYIQRIEDILAPIVGVHGVRAQVVADIDFTVTEQTQEKYDPDLPAIRSEQVREEQRVGVNGPLGVPGALSNQPPGGGVAPEVVKTGKEKQGSETSSTSTATTPGSSSKSSIKNYELDRTISHTRLSPGAIKRLSIAVLVDERHSVDAQGNEVTTPLSKEEMDRIHALVMDAVGFNQARGDSLNIVNTAFVKPEPVAPLPEPPIWQQPWVWNIAKQVLGGLFVLFLVFGVIKPAFKDLNTVPVQGEGDSQAEGESGQAGAGTGGQAGEIAATSSDEIAQIATGSAELEDKMNNIRSLVQQEPELVAQVVKNWTASDK